MKKLPLIAIALIVAMGVSVFLFRRPLFGQFVCSIQNPEKTFQLDVYGYPSFGLRMPGQGSDRPGFVRLKRLSDGVVLETSDLEMLQTAYNPIWTADLVELRLIAEWRLR